MVGVARILQSVSQDDFGVAGKVAGRLFQILGAVDESRVAVVDQEWLYGFSPRLANPSCACLVTDSILLPVLRAAR